VTGFADPRDVVARKRDGHTLSEDEIRDFVLVYARGEIPDYLAAAFLMAAYIRGLTAEETLGLTRAMVESGETLSLAGIDRPIVDKHSTGGVADTVTLVFVPLAAALGLGVAKLSGRGLGHTGGTLDKLESIPGFRTDLEPSAFRRQVDEIGCAVAAQSAELVPADKALYALRDATATVPSVPLIAASVMSKKLAVDSDLVLLDVKARSGAFMKTVARADELALACVELGRRWGRRVRAAVTDMSQPLGEAVGNALDVAEAVDVLRGGHRRVLNDLALEFAAVAQESLLGTPREEGRGRAERALTSGEAADRFARMVAAQGGDARIVEDPRGVLPRAPVVVPLESDRSGYLSATDAERIGWAAAHLGAGRIRKDDAIDPSVGIVFRAKIGDLLEVGEPIGEVHARNDASAADAAEQVLSALEVTEAPVERRPVVYVWRDG
jgi:pyrimidine-nucleoside phosphorylase